MERRQPAPSCWEPHARSVLPAVSPEPAEVALRRGVGKRNLFVHTPARLRAQL